MKLFELSDILSGTIMIITSAGDRYLNSADVATDCYGDYYITNICTEYCADIEDKIITVYVTKESDEEEEEE